VRSLAKMASGPFIEAMASLIPQGRLYSPSTARAKALACSVS